MSVSAISGSSYSYYSSESIIQQLQQEFKQLGSDLQSGSLSAAQSDFATLQQELSQASDSSSQSASPLEQAFSQLSQDLQAGNLTGAQQDFQAITRYFYRQELPWAQSAQVTESTGKHPQ